MATITAENLVAGTCFIAEDGRKAQLKRRSDNGAIVVTYYAEDLDWDGEDTNPANVRVAEERRINSF